MVYQIQRQTASHNYQTMAYGCQTRRPGHRNNNNDGRIFEMRLPSNGKTSPRAFINDEDFRVNFC